MIDYGNNAFEMKIRSMFHVKRYQKCIIVLADVQSLEQPLIIGGRNSPKLNYFDNFYFQIHLKIQERDLTVAGAARQRLPVCTA